MESDNIKDIKESLKFFRIAMWGFGESKKNV